MRSELAAVERALGWLVGLPFASWRYLARDVELHREDGACAWPIRGFPEADVRHPGDPASLQRPVAGSGPAFHRTYSVLIDRAQLSAAELMAVVGNDPNVACPLEIARFERRTDSRPLEPGEEMRVRLPGPWNGPVRVVGVDDTSFRLATLSGHMEAGEIEFRAEDVPEGLAFTIESWARSSDRVFDLLYDRLGVARELQLDMWAFFLERVAQVAGGAPRDGIAVRTMRCADHPL